MKILQLFFVFIFIASIATANVKYDINQHSEFKLFLWGQTKTEIENTFEVSLIPGATKNIYTAQKFYKNNPANYIFSFTKDSLQSIIIITQMSNDERLKEIEIFKKLVASQLGDLNT